MLRQDTGDDNPERDDSVTLVEKNEDGKNARSDDYSWSADGVAWTRKKN